jgi:MFS family permease
MENFTRLTNTENRGRYSGLIMFLSGLGIVTITLIDTGSIEFSALILIAWRLLGLIFLIFQKVPKEKVRNKDVSFAFVLHQRSFILYLIPWLMFSLVNYLSIPVQYNVLGESTVNLLMVVESAIIGIFAIISGFLLDNFGRKRTAIAGFVLIGIGYSILGLYPYEMASWFFYTAVDGLAWGIFYVLFMFLIWGDLSNDAKSDKYYAIGILPFFISKYLQLILGNYVAASISSYALFSFIAFFLFIAVLPLVYAPETLPEKTMKDRELKGYVEKALKQAQKEAGKSQKKDSAKAEKENDMGKEAEETHKYEEARKLAEKYY